jgi:hypothetical protein
MTRSIGVMDLYFVHFVYVWLSLFSFCKYYYVLANICVCGLLALSFSQLNYIAPTFFQKAGCKCWSLDGTSILQVLSVQLLRRD